MRVSKPLLRELCGVMDLLVMAAKRHLVRLYETPNGVTKLAILRGKDENMLKL